MLHHPGACLLKCLLMRTSQNKWVQSSTSSKFISNLEIRRHFCKFPRLNLFFKKNKTQSTCATSHVDFVADGSWSTEGCGITNPGSEVVRRRCDPRLASPLWHYQTISDQINTENKIPGFSSPRVLILDWSFWSQEQEEPLSSIACLQYLHEVSNCLWIALTNLFRIGRGFGYCHFSFMTSKGPVVKIGKEHSQRDVGNQRCFLSNSLSGSGTTTPAAHGKISSQQQRERENRAKEGEREIIKRAG